MVVPKKPKIPEPIIPPFELDEDEPLAMLYNIYGFCVLH